VVLFAKSCWEHAGVYKEVQIKPWCSFCR